MLKKSLIQIINEEIENFYSDWQMDEPSIADRVFSKITGNQQMQPKSEISGELVGYIRTQWGRVMKASFPLYKNPKNLNGFDVNARGILLNNGDLYLSTSQNAMHDDILDLLAEKGIIPLQSKNNYGKNYPNEFIAVQRALKSTTFAQSRAYDNFPIYYNEIFELANKKQPFNFKKLYVNDGDVD